MRPLSCAARRAWEAVSTQVATPRVPVCGVHRWVRPVLKVTGWPLSGRPDVVSVAVRVTASRGLRPMRAVSVVRAG